MIYVTTVTITATNTAQSVWTGSREMADWVTLQSGPDNQGSVYHGPPDVTSSTGQVIGSGGGGGSPQYPPVSGVTGYDLRRIYIVGTQDDIVRVMYFRR